MEIPKIYRASSLSSCAVTSESIEDLYFDITSFDDSCIPSTRQNSNSSEKNFDTSSDISVEYENYYSSSKISGVSSNESEETEITQAPKPKKQHHYKSLSVIIKLLKNFSIKDSGKKTGGVPARSNIFRPPKEYVFQKGISGITMRVEKSSSPSPVSAKNFCHRCYIRNG
jgi:hypothetical protein